MAQGRIKMEGLEDLKANLLALDEAVATKIGVKADRDAANILKSALVEAAPYDPTAESPYGHLRENIRVRKQQVRTAHTIRYVVDTGKAFWGAFVELGTVKMAARPWMRPVFERLVAELREAQEQGLRDGIEREAKRTARIAKRSGGG